MTLHNKAMPDSNSKSSVTISTPGLFDFEEALVYLNRSSLECMHLVGDGAVYKLLEVDGEYTLIKINTNNERELQISCLNRTPSSYEPIKAYVKDWLDLRTDMAPFYRMAKNDPILGALTQDYAGLRVIGVPDLFEALCWAVIGQQVNLTFAYTVKKRLVESYGDSYEWDGQSFWLFPTPEKIAELTVEDLKALQLTGRKAEYILHIAKLMSDGELSKDTLMEMEAERAEEKLLSIRGIGPWSAHYVMMRCLRDPSAFPIGDAGLHNALKHLLARSKKPSLEEIRSIFKPWKGWEAYAVFYLWRSLHG
ncbi:DNA-3-methyladenine glycosylase family protein [Pseudalkalibacillus sp. Hm43]|uniref:DNA-3-methyladenine glycosylase family protein n=1 Tax=Pseudalkalibacillus sp. Hm43 TaxID=3450742 RepID=UPI003F4213A3